MKSSNWDKVIPGAARFVMLTTFGNAAVRDNETGLVWERSPEATLTTWFGETGAINICINKTIGGRKGWRLPAVDELASLLDLSVSPPTPGPALTAGHPFTNIQADVYWTATTVQRGPAAAWLVSFAGGNVFPDDKADSHYFWCVRGGMNADAY